jgi:serine/threonine-protein kinase HipA
VGHSHALLTERFDRQGLFGQETKKHYLSASALLDIPYESHLGSYLELANMLRRISIQATKDLEQLFKRLVFNVMVDNTDDHVKNHGVIHVERGLYRLSPAFDVVMQMTNLGYQELAILPGKHYVKWSDVLEIAPYLGITHEKAQQLIQEFQAMIPIQLMKNIQQYGGTPQLMDRVKRCLERQSQLLEG